MKENKKEIKKEESGARVLSNWSLLLSHLIAGSPLRKQGTCFHVIWVRGRRHLPWAQRCWLLAVDTREEQSTLPS